MKIRFISAVAAAVLAAMLAGCGSEIQDNAEVSADLGVLTADEDIVTNEEDALTDEEEAATPVLWQRKQKKRSRLSAKSR